MTAAAWNLQRISRMLRKDLYFSSNDNTIYKMLATNLGPRVC